MLTAYTEQRAIVLLLEHHCEGRSVGLLPANAWRGPSFAVGLRKESEMSDELDRLRSMLLDDGQTWDLSPNDKEAIRHALGCINLLSDEVAGHTGSTVPAVMEAVEAEVTAIRRNEGYYGPIPEDEQCTNT